MSVVLGRRLLASAQQTQRGEDAGADELTQLRAHDRFFCETMENIPAAFYFPTDAEANWRKHQPKKYHKNVQAQRQQESSKKAQLKRAKFSPAAQQSNEARQQAAAEQELKQKREQQEQPQEPTADTGAGGLEGLRARLAVKIQAMREQRKAEEKTGRKRPSRAEQAAEQRALKKRKTAANKSKAKAEKREQEAADKASAAAAGKEQEAAAASADGASISYGSLLLEEATTEKQPKTRNGQGVRGIQNLLKKAERNAQRLEELKRTEEGAEKAKQKGWSKALQQAAGEVVLDDPKLLRAKLKKKEKAKAKSSKEWKERTARLEVAKKERQKKKLANAMGRKAKDSKDDKPEKKGRKGPRAGFEGKKGEAFLNADKKKAPAKGKAHK